MSPPAAVFRDNISLSSFPFPCIMRRPDAYRPAAPAEPRGDLQPLFQRGFSRTSLQGPAIGVECGAEQDLAPTDIERKVATRRCSNDLVKNKHARCAQKKNAKHDVHRSYADLAIRLECFVDRVSKVLGSLNWKARACLVWYDKNIFFVNTTRTFRKNRL